MIEMLNKVPKISFDRQDAQIQNCAWSSENIIYFSGSVQHNLTKSDVEAKHPTDWRSRGSASGPRTQPNKPY